MTEKRKYNAGMNRKGLESFVTEDQARHMATHQGHNYLFIVSAHSGAKTIAEDGSEVVQIVPDIVELVPTEHAERVRQLQRAFYLARPDQYGQAAFEGATKDEPTVDGALADAESVIERDENGDPAGVWDGSMDGPLEPSAGDDGLDGDEGPWPGDEAAAGGSVHAVDFSGGK